MPHNLHTLSGKKKLEKSNVFFTSAPPPLYPVKNANILKKALPTLAFASSVVGALGYLIGGIGLFYDLYHDKKEGKASKDKVKEEGVKTITASTEFGKFAINCGRTAVAATAIAGITCGLGEGIPLMAIGEATNLNSARIIETPTGTALFGIGIASIFAGLALDNTPELKLNEFELMAAKGFKEKSKLILKNTQNIAKEIGVSIFQIARNCYKPSFWKEDMLRITPKTVVFSESINKDGKITLSKALRHNKNYLMHAASFTLALGGFGIILSTIFNQKKTQKTGLQVEETGFLFDNLGMTKYGIDKFTTGGKSGLSFAMGGVMTAISQFLGLDNKEGRGLFWLGISGVFLGFSIDRGKHLREELTKLKKRPELTRVVREWKIDLSKIIADKTQLNKVLKEIKTVTVEKPVKHPTIVKIESALKSLLEGDFNADNEKVQKNLKMFLEKSLGETIANGIIANVRRIDVADAQKSQDVLRICTKKIFGSENPTPVAESVK